MTTTEAPLVQPVERVLSVEQALRAFALDPDLDSREGAFTFGFIEGGLAGTVYAHTLVLPGEFADLLNEAYSTSLRPMPFADALAFNGCSSPQHRLEWHGADRRFNAKGLRVVGRLTGWRLTTEDVPGAKECPVCSRRLFAEFDADASHDCVVDGVVLCGGSRDCWKAFCVGPEHAICRDEPDTSCTAAVAEAVSS